MQVIHNQSIVDIDWQLVEADQEIPENGNIIVQFDQFSENTEQLLSRADQLGVAIPSNISVDELADHLPALSLIAVEIDKYTDGRAFSQARLLRDKYEYSGEILAIGDMLRDQVADLCRCGVSMIAFTDSRNIEDALEAFKEFSVHYQPPSNDGKVIGVLS